VSAEQNCSLSDSALVAHDYEETVAPLARWCSPHMWEANSSESCAWKFRTIHLVIDQRAIQKV
jgi:hypothetical protein